MNSMVDKFRNLARVPDEAQRTIGAMLIGSGKITAADAARALRLQEAGHPPPDKSGRAENCDGFARVIQCSAVCTWNRSASSVRNGPPAT